MLAKEHPVLLLCYFVVRLFQVLAGGSRYPRETDEFGTVLFFVRERDVNKRASSGEAGFNSAAWGAMV